MAKKQAVDLSQFRGKFKYSEVKVSECTNGTFQVRNKNIGVNIDDLKDSIEVSGLIQPIGVARSEVTEGSDLYEWEIVWGQRRHYAFESLGLETIPAMVLDEVISPEEGKALSVIENLIRVDMQTKEVWNAIEEIYLTFGSGNLGKDAQICAEKTGIPLSTVKDAIRVELVKNLKNGEKMYRYAQEKRIPKSQAIDILNICRKSDGITVDEKKTQEFVDYYAAQDNKLRVATLAAAKQNPGGTLEQWKESAITIEKTKPKTMKIDFPQRTYDRIELASTSEGLTPVEWAFASIASRLDTEGF